MIEKQDSQQLKLGIRLLVEETASTRSQVTKFGLGPGSDTMNEW
jgi:hypothetical protein